MSEFQTGIFKLIKNTSVGRALVYTIGHIIIAMSVVSVLTGASLWEAGAVALVEPTINGVSVSYTHLTLPTNREV